MHASFTATPMSHAHACRIIEGLCEGYVQAMMAEFEAAPKGEYPCCTRCGGFCVKAGPMCPSTHEPIVELLGRRRAATVLQQRHDEAEDAGAHKMHVHQIPILAATRGPMDTGDAPSSTVAVRVRSPKGIVAVGGGTTIELSCYHAALKRLRGNDPHCRVVIVECDEPGTFRGFVLHSDAHENPDKRGTIDDPVLDANKNAACACGGHNNGADLIGNSGIEQGEQGEQIDGVAYGVPPTGDESPWPPPHWRTT